MMMTRLDNAIRRTGHDWLANVRPSTRVPAVILKSVLTLLGATVISSAVVLAQMPTAPTLVRVVSAGEDTQTPGMTMSPINAALAPGGTQRFAAAITGTTNRTVNWTATGGTVASDGTYTAGATAGVYTVTATITGGTLFASASIANSGPPAIKSYLSDRSWTSMTNGWGPVERNRTNGEAAEGDGLPLSHNGVAYAKGLGAHSRSDVRYALNKTCASFGAVIGVSPETGGKGSVVFQVLADGVQRYSSGIMTATTPAKSILVDTSNVAELALVLTDGGDGVTSDHGDWADAHVICETAPPLAGTAITPGQDIQARVNVEPPGTTFVLKAGIHRMQSITPKTGQSFVGEAGTILSGARVLTSFSRNGSAWVASGQTQQGKVSGSTTDGVCRGDSPRCGYPEDLFINDVPLRHVASVSAGGPGRWYFDYGADQIYFWDDPTGKTVETSVTPEAFSGTATGVTIRNVVVEKYAAPTHEAAVALGTGWVIEGSEVRLNHFSGIGQGSSSIARGNKVHHNGCFGFQGAGGGVVVENNEISYNNYAGYSSFWGAGGSKWVYTDGLIVRGNFSHHNDGPGLWTDINNINTLYENNIVEDNARGGIFHEISYSAIIRNNTIRRNGTGRDYPYWTTGAGIEIVGSANVEVYGNTLEDNWQGITGLDDGRADPAVQNHGPWTLINLNVHDNIVIQKTNLGPGSGRSGVVTFIPGTFTAAAKNVYRANKYTLGTYTNYFMWEAGDINEAQWKTAGQDMTGTFAR